MFVLSSSPSSFTAGAPVAPNARITRAARLIGSVAWLIALLAALPTQAATWSVGVGTGCTHTTIQAAIDTAQNNPGADTIRITRSLFYIEQALVLSTAQEVDLVGGFAICNQAASDGVLTDVSGINGAEEPVMRITINSGGLVRLRHLTILRGDEDGTGNGGGIFFRGNGSLQISDSAITNNIAGYGGGIYAEGTGTNAELIIGRNVQISSNTARYSGGGIYVDGLEMAMREQGSVIAFNTAQGVSDSGFGGGLIVLARGTRSAYAYIGSGGFGSGTIFGNTARYGGGVALVGSRESTTGRASLDFYTTQADRRSSIRANVASVAGGAIYQTHGGGIISGGGVAEAFLWNADLVDNRAPEGAAVFAEDMVFNAFFFNPGALPDGALACPIGAPCGVISGNRAETPAGLPTSGAVFEMRGALLSINGTSIPRGGVLIQRNQGGRLLNMGADNYDGEDSYFRNVSIIDNQFTQQLVRDDGGGGFRLVDSTVAGNTIGAAQIFSATAEFTLQRSIIWQPNKTSLTQSGGTRTVEWSIASEVNSLGGGVSAVFAPPRFLDPARGDYRLRAASPAIDFGPPVAGDDRDIHGLLRDVRIPEVFRFNPLQTRDAGAHERPALQPLVLNGDLDVDLNLWTPATANAATWDTAQNAPGSTGGSIRVNLNNIPQARVVAMTQCIHLPGPGVYALNGWGRSGLSQAPTRDALILAWELRNNGTEACNVGPPTISGEHNLFTASNWGSPPPNLINVTPAQWNNRSSISISLVVVDRGVEAPGSVTGWFDRITLELAPSDIIFANGFN